MEKTFSLVAQPLLQLKREIRFNHSLFYIENFINCRLFIGILLARFHFKN